LSSGSRVRTSYGYEEKKSVAAQDSGVTVEVGTPYVVPKTGVDVDDRLRVMLNSRNGFVGSSPDSIAGNVVNKLKNYYTAYDYSLISNTGTLNKGSLQTIFDDLTSTQFGEDK